MYIYIYIHIYIERERETKLDTCSKDDVDQVTKNVHIYRSLY